MSGDLIIDGAIYAIDCVTRFLPSHPNDGITVDVEDYAILNNPALRIINKTRHKKRKLYAELCYRRNDGKMMHEALHRIVMGVTDPNVLVDHKDGNGLNCRRKNLRTATRADNARNTSVRSDSLTGVKGVSRLKSGKFIARIFFLRERMHLGTFDTVGEAAAAYRAAAKVVHGSFANDAETEEVKG